MRKELLYFAVATALTIQSVWAQCPNKPYAGKDTTTCVAEVDLADAKGTQAWYFLSGPQDASIGRFNGIVPDLFVPGSYQFVLKDTVTECSDTVAVQRIAQPSANLQIIGDTICANAANAKLTIHSGIGAGYNVTVNGNSFTSGIINSDELFVLIPANQLFVGENKVVVQSVLNSVCNVVLLEQNTVILVHASPVVVIKAAGDTVCSNSSTARVKISGVPAGVAVQAFKGATPIGSSVISTGGVVVIQFPVSSLTVGTNKIVVSASIAGCSVQTVKDSAYVLVNKLPSLSLVTVGDTVFENEDFAYPYIINAEVWVSYQPYIGAIAFGPAQLGAGGKLEVPISVSGLSLGNNAVTFRASIQGCTTVDLTNIANVLVEPKVITSVEATELANICRVWPNPLVNELHVEAPNQGAAVKVTIVDALGVVVVSKTFAEASFSFAPVLTNGVYQLQVESGTYKHTTKVVKQE